MALSVQIEKSYGDFHLDVSFEAGWETLALLGASGCGKSLTLKCIAGIEKPDSGRIVLDGKVLYDSAERICLPPQQRRVGYLFQQYALFPNMTAEQNIAAGAFRLSRPERAERTEELIEMFHLEEAMGKFPYQLSGGQQQRVALARILISEPEVILLDEPFSALDSHLKWQLELELNQLLAIFGGTVLWVSHDRGEALRNCQRVCVLEDGTSLPVTDMRSLVDAPETVSAARIAGCRNLVDAAPSDDLHKVSIPTWNLVLQCTRPWKSGVRQVGIHARHVRPAPPDAPNSFLCQVVRIIEDVSSTVVLLRPAGAWEEAPLLAMELDPAQPRPSGTCTVSLPPDQILLLQ